MTDHSDADDTPEQQQQLRAAWEAIAAYAQSCDDSDRPGAVTVLNMIGRLISGDDNEGEPFSNPGVTFVSRAAADTFTCPTCKRTFSTQQGLINHLKSVHAERERTPYKKNDPNQTWNT